jgi:hypothetical protein
MKELKFFRALTIRYLKAGDQKIMVIANFQVQHILRAYSQQLSVRSRAPKEKVGKNPVQKDEVMISQESKKRLVADRISHEIIAQLGNRSGRNGTSRTILDRLSQEYGQPLDVENNDGQGLVFKILGDTEGKISESLAPADNEQLKKRLFDITQSVVYNDLIKGEGP